jgi:dUTP pyrophosphatase
MNEKHVWPNSTDYLTTNDLVLRDLVIKVPEQPSLKIYSENDKCFPHIGSEYAAGLDLRIVWDGRDDFKVLEPNIKYQFRTGVHVAIPEGWCGIVAPRSGLGSKFEVSLCNTIGIIDSDYRGEIGIFVKLRGTEPLTIDKYERICQMIVVPHWDPNLNTRVNSIEELGDTRRGAAGWGSSGTK